MLYLARRLELLEMNISSCLADPWYSQRRGCIWHHRGPGTRQSQRSTNPYHLDVADVIKRCISTGVGDSARETKKKETTKENHKEEWLGLLGRGKATKSGFEGRGDH